MYKKSKFYPFSPIGLIALCVLLLLWGCQSESDQSSQQEPMLTETNLAEHNDDVVLISEEEPTIASNHNDNARYPTSFARSISDEEINNFILKKKKVQVHEYLPTNEPEFIFGEEGTTVRIVPESFVYTDGTPLESGVEVRIELREYFTKSDMILSGLATNAGERFLESGGMIHIAASAEGKPLKLATEKKIDIKMPKEKTQVRSRKGMQTFLANNPAESPATNWEATGMPAKVQRVRKPPLRYRYQKEINPKHKAVEIERKDDNEFISHTVLATELRYTKLETNFPSDFEPITQVDAKKKPAKLDIQRLSSFRTRSANASISLLHDFRHKSKTDSLFYTMNFDNYDSRYIGPSDSDLVYTDTLKMLFTMDKYGNFHAQGVHFVGQSQHALHYEIMRSNAKNPLEVNPVLITGGTQMKVLPALEKAMFHKIKQLHSKSHKKRHGWYERPFFVSGSLWEKAANTVRPLRTKRELAYQQRQAQDFQIPYKGSDVSFVLTMVIDWQKQHWEFDQSSYKLQTSYYIYDIEDNQKAYRERLARVGLKAGHVADLEDYMLSSTSLGWINCDVFWDVPNERKVDLLVQEQVPTRLIFKNINSIMKSSAKDGMRTFASVPKGEPAFVMAVKREKGQLMVALEEVQISDAPIGALNYKPVNSLAELEKKLAFLNKG
ncbi:MAG: hypothetical protein JJT94_10670 [Bernardetiaceae bacterium]|nr:hypothetical protein [Bernardetiaceae bacterium]